MSLDRARVRALVRAELEKRLDEPPPARVHAALLDIYQGPAPGCNEDLDSRRVKILERQSGRQVRRTARSVEGPAYVVSIGRFWSVLFSFVAFASLREG